MTYFQSAGKAIHNALWAILTALAALITASSVLYAIGFTMLPADAIVFLAAAAILVTRGVVDHRADVDHRVDVSTPGSLACPSLNATLEAGFANLFHCTLAVLTLGLSRTLRSKRRQRLLKTHRLAARLT
ncbi:MAG: hypothetical protein ACTSX7_04055 [Alphaproteobacteria bacterium]